MVGCRFSSLARILDEGSPPPALFGTILKKWEPGDDEAPNTAICSSRATVNLAVGAWAETWWAPHELFCTLTGRHSKGVDQLTFFAVDGDGLVSLLRSLFVIAGGEYKEGPGNLWLVKGEIPAEGLPTLVNFNSLQFSLNALFRGIG